MSSYIKFYDEAPMWLRIVLSVFAIFPFLYRLFKVIIDKAEMTANLVYLILNVVPIVGTIIWVFDIIKCALKKPLPLNFSEVFGAEAKPAEEKKAE